MNTLSVSKPSDDAVGLSSVTLSYSQVSHSDNSAINTHVCNYKL